MDTTYHSNIPIETLSLLDCDVKNFNFIHPIKNIFFDNIDYIRKLDASGKARPCILDNVERSLLCHTCYLALISLNVRIVTTGILFHILVIQDSVMPVVLNMPNSLQPKPLLFVLTALIDTLSLLFLKNLETGSDRIVLDSIFCLLLLETPFPFSPINLLPINSKRKNYRIPTIYSKTFLFVMNLA